ncbi:MAG TPA: hypothetical protein VLD18_16285, partial [Verrucomicrobiae bacterium]|nr:hypothetical protein [Verrucomicrobiae bacterium]
MATVRFSPDGTRIVTASADNTARIWDSATGRPLTEPIRHDDEVTSAVFSPDGGRVLTASIDSTARVWDAETGRPLTEPWRHGGPLWTAAFSPDGSSVVTASADGTARLWESRPAPVPVPVWFLDWSEARIGRRLATGVAGIGIPFAEQRRRRNALAGRREDDFFVRIARWVESDPANRPITPFGMVSTSDYRQSRLEENNVAGIQEAIQLDPSDGGAWLQLARLYQLQNDWDNPHRLAEAEWCVQTSLKHAPHNAAAWRLLGTTQWLEDHTAAALVSMERALTLEPGHAEAWGWKARMLEEEQNPAGALDAYRRGLALISTTNGATSRQRAAMQVELSVLLRRLGQADDAVTAAAMQVEAHRTLGIPARDPGAPAGLLDLSPWYNAALVGAWHPGVENNDLAGLPSGVQQFGDTTFDLRGVVQLAGRRNLKEYFPAARTGLEVNRKFRRLHALHATGWAEQAGVTIAVLRVHFADGQQHEFPIRYGEEVLDWFAQTPKVGSRSNGLQAWQGVNGAGFGVQLFQSTWENPHPDLEVRSL